MGHGAMENPLRCCPAQKTHDCYGLVIECDKGWEGWREKETSDQTIEGAAVSHGNKTLAIHTNQI